MEGYRESKYNFNLEVNDGLVLYNAKTGAIGVVEPSEREKICNILRAPERWASHDETVTAELLNSGFLVPQDADETADIKQWYEQYISDPHIVHLTVLPTESCNFRCPYCFLYKQRGIFMHEWVYDGMLRFLEYHLSGLQRKALVYLSWYGGEPLLAWKQIVDFMCSVNSLKERRNVEFHSGIATNGYMLSPKIFRRLLDAGVDEFQVTLDGDASTHDSLRILTDGRPTFDVIYLNLLKMRDVGGWFKVKIRGNFLRTTLDSMEKLLHRFARDFGKDPRFSIYFRPVYDFETERQTIEPLSPVICSLREGIHLQNELALKTMELLGNLDDGVRIFDPLPKPGLAWCEAVRRYSYIVGADGTIFACDTLTDADLGIGRITADGKILYDKRAQEWKTNLFQDDASNDCLDCKLLPICLGGCQRIRVQQGKRSCFWAEDDIRTAMEQYVRL